MRGGGGDNEDEGDAVLMVGGRTAVTEEKVGDASVDGRRRCRT